MNITIGSGSYYPFINVGETVNMFAGGMPQLGPLGQTTVLNISDNPFSNPTSYTTSDTMPVSLLSGGLGMGFPKVVSWQGAVYPILPFSGKDGLLSLCSEADMLDSNQGQLHVPAWEAHWLVCGLVNLRTCCETNVRPLYSYLALHDCRQAGGLKITQGCTHGQEEQMLILYGPFSTHILA